VSLEKVRNAAALQLLGHIWDIHFPKGKGFNDDQFRLLCRDSLVLADVFLGVASLPQHELLKVVQAKPPPAPAAEQTVEVAS
jgi:hypothetical protein